MRQKEKRGKDVGERNTSKRDRGAIKTTERGRQKSERERGASETEE